MPAEPSLRIPLLDLTEEVRALWPELDEALRRVLFSGHFILGPEGKSLESEVAAFLALPHAVGLNSGTDALVIGLRALGVGPGDEVITTPFSFFATAEAISQVGAVPVFADIEPESMNIDPDRVQEALSPRTRAIIPVHLFGRSARMDRIEALAERRGLRVLEDAAQAFGARVGGRPIGSSGDATALSFFPSKNLGAYGDGGMLVTPDAEVAAQARALRSHGSRVKYVNERLGYNSRLDEVQAAILRVKLRHVAAWNEARREAAARYDAMLSGLDGVVAPAPAAPGEHVYHQYTVRILGGRRERVRAHLENAGIGTAVYYPIPLHRLPVYADRGLSMPVAERAAEEVLSLPIGPCIREAEQSRVAEALREACRG